MARLDAFLERTAHPAPDVGRPRSRSSCTKWSAATGCATASSICRSPAAWRGATFRFRRTARRRRWSSWRATPTRRGSNGSPPRASPSSPCPTSAGAASTSRAWRCCPTCSPSRPRASRARARPGWSTAQGRVTEGASSNAWIVSRDGVLITRPLGHDILPGITRSVVIDAVQAQGLTFEERAFTVEEAYAAREAFVTSASQLVLPVVSIDGRPVGNGAPGLIATALAARLPPPRRGLLSAAPRPSSRRRRVRHRVTSRIGGKSPLKSSSWPARRPTWACTGAFAAI